MTHAGMVHALKEVQRVLRPNGILIDLRPLEQPWPLEIASAAEVNVAGWLNAVPSAVADDQAAFHAIAEVQSQGWFVNEREEAFSYFYYWDTPTEVKEFMDEEWAGLDKMDTQLYNKIRSVWAAANADARLRMRVSMHIARWRKQADRFVGLK